MWKSGCLWSWGHRLPCWKVPREGRQQHASAQIPTDSHPLPPQCPGGGGTPSPLAFRSPRVPLPPPAGRMLPCEPGWGSPGSREAQRGPEPCYLGPATPPLPTRPLKGLSIHASGVHGLRKVSDPKGLSDADLAKPPTLAPPEKWRGGPADMESISHRPSLKYTKHQRRKPGVLLVDFLFFSHHPVKNSISFKTRIPGS